MTDEAKPVAVEQGDRLWKCPEPKHRNCMQELVIVNPIGFNIWRCKNCGSEEWL